MAEQEGIHDLLRQLNEHKEGEKNFNELVEWVLEDIVADDIIVLTLALIIVKEKINPKIIDDLQNNVRQKIDASSVERKILYRKCMQTILGYLFDNFDEQMKILKPTQGDLRAFMLEYLLKNKPKEWQIRRDLRASIIGKGGISVTNGKETPYARLAYYM